MSKQDDVFLKQFGALLSLLVVFAFAAYFLGTGLAESSVDDALAKPTATLDRIRPVGQVKVAAAASAAAAKSKTISAPAKVAMAAPAPKAAPAVVAPTAATPAVATAEESGRPADAIYKTVCMACHVTGIANAPKTGDKAAWEARMANGIDGLVNSVMNGKGVMPPKAGNPSLTKDEVTRSVKWFLEQAGIDAG